MNANIQYLAGQFNLQTRLFSNVTAGVPDANSVKTLNENTNHIAWLTGHIVSTRFMMAAVLGITAQEPFPALFANSKGRDAAAVYPPMNELTRDWNSISEKIAAALEALPAEALQTKMPQPVPTGDTLGDFLGFLMHHEAYSIGQLGIARRFFGLEAMTYN